jgi:glycosyltransferase involved in cell wall biosynthesis
LIRVLFLAESFHPVLGGGEGHVRELGRRLVAGGSAVTVVTRRGEASWPAEEWLDGMRVVRVPPSGPGRRGKFAMTPAAMAALWRERDAYDVLVVRGTRVLGLPGLVAGRLSGRPVVLQPEINGEMSGEVYTWGTRLAKRPWRHGVAAAVAARNLLLRDADAFVAMSRKIRDEFLAAGVAPERVAHLPHGVDTDRFRPGTPAERKALRERLGLPPSGPIVTYTGRLLKGKGLETLVDAFAGVASRHPAAHLLVVGSGADQALSIEESLRESVRRLGLAERTTFAGRVDTVEDYLRASDVFAFPSEFEALGLSLIEAAACGLPAVGSRTGGIVDVIEDGASGLLVEPGDARALAEALDRLLGDAGLRAELGARGHAIARARFDLEDSVQRYRALFREVSSRRGVSRPERAPRADAAPPR